MTKKQWVAPSAQLVQFAANEYVAACGTGWSIIGAVQGIFAFLDVTKDGDLTISNWRNSATSSWSYAITDFANENAFSELGKSSTEGLLEGKDVVIESADNDNDGHLDHWLGFEGDFLDTSNFSKSYDGFYAQTAPDAYGDNNYTNANKATIWHDITAKNGQGGYYVTTYKSVARS